MMNDSVDCSSGGNNFISNLLRAAKEIESSATRHKANQVVISNNLYGKLHELFSDEQRLMKVSIEYYDE